MGRIRQISGMSRENPHILFFSRHSNPKYWPFSNFYTCKFRMNSEWWKSVEHCYQAHKTLDTNEFSIIRDSETAAIAKQNGRACTLRSDWENIKYSIMEQAVYAKFSQNQICRGLLLGTKDLPIHEDSPFDYVWGWRNNGKDLLGKILMDVRQRIRDELVII